MVALKHLSVYKITCSFSISLERTNNSSELLLGCHLHCGGVPWVLGSRSTRADEVCPASLFSPPFPWMKAAPGSTPATLPHTLCPCRGSPWGGPPRWVSLIRFGFSSRMPASLQIRATLALQGIKVMLVATCWHCSLFFFFFLVNLFRTWEGKDAVIY